MAKTLQCTEIQLTLHTIIVVIIGILIGSSLVPKAEDIDSKLTDKVFEDRSQYDQILQHHKELSDKFKENYEDFKALVYNGAEVGCKRVGNYALDHSKEGIKIEMIETFKKIPKVFLSINGFYFQPKLVKEEKSVEIISFTIGDIKNNQFFVKIESDDTEFKVEDFDRIDLCYLAFTDLNGEFDPLINTN